MRHIVALYEVVVGAAHRVSCLLCDSCERTCHLCDLRQPPMNKSEVNVG